MIISCDIDCVLNNLVEVVLEQYNNDANDNLTVEQITKYNLYEFTKPGYNLNKYFNSRYTYKFMKWNVQWIADIIDNFCKSESLFEIYFTTSTTIENALHKFQALCEAINNVSCQSYNQIKNYVSNHYITTQNKQLIKANIIIDDCIDNLQLINNTVYNILVVQPWNLELAYQYNIKYKNNPILICHSINDIMKCLNIIEQINKNN